MLLSFMVLNDILLLFANLNQCEYIIEVIANVLFHDCNDDTQLLEEELQEKGKAL